MPLVYVLNAVLGSWLLFALMFTDYINKFHSDSFQRGVFIRILIFALIGNTADFFYLFLNGHTGVVMRYVLYGVLTGYYFFEVGAFYFIALFFDYLSFRDIERGRKIIRGIWVVFGIHALILAANLNWGFYFFIDGENRFVRGSAYTIRLVISYLPVVFIVLDLFLSLHIYKKSQVSVILLFILLTGTGATLDIVLGQGSLLIWPCFSASLLYMYFFIVRGDARIDALTGLGNRYSFEEFIEVLAKSKAKIPYAVVMIDVDRFKKINDTLGHAEGDNALRDLGVIIKSCIRQTDFAARYGGDEFVLATPAESNVERLLERIKGVIRRQNDENRRPYRLEISCGYDVFVPQNGQSIGDFMRHIDGLMYKNKAERRRAGDRIA
jgi:diguanylate cyclase (GGDEF)-like protein